MNNSPAFQLYPQDFLSDLNVAAMNMEELGVYWKLLCHCWIEDGLPLETDTEGWLPFGSTISQPWDKIWFKVGKCFYKKNGKWRNKRLDLERKKQLIWREKSKRGGIKSGELRRRKGRVVEPKGKRSTSRVVEPKGNSSSSSSSSSSIKEDLRKSSYIAHFEEFWSQYPAEGRLAKEESKKKFIALCKRGELEEFKKGCLGYGDFLKHKRIVEHFEQTAMYAKTFLNGRWKEFIGFKYEAPL